MYYDKEAPLPLNIELLERKLLCVTDDEKKALAVVLSEFFVPTDNGYVNERCGIEIEKYRKNTSAKAKAGIASAAKRKQNSTRVERNPTPVERNPTPVANQELRTKNHNHLTSSAEAKDDERLASWIFEKIAQVVPGTKKPNLAKWATTIRLMRERDKLTHRRIAEVFSWANGDSFWKTNILSPDKLREKFPQLAAKHSQMAPESRQQLLIDRLGDRSWAEGLECYDGTIEGGSDEHDH
jgi:uncharacterized protein YdaU (DUF1376 family)